ncbi:MAG: hypothetical protein V2A76_07185 [Planctomycetota bacterium]
MKGLIIITVLVLGFGGALYVLLRPSDMDLVRVEQDAESLLQETSMSLAGVTRTLNSLRSIRPNLTDLDRELNQMRAGIESRKALLDGMREERPGRGEDHAPFLRRRRELRQDLDQLNRSASDLLDRVELVDEYMRTTQARVQLMKERFRDLFQMRRKLEQAGTPLDPELVAKIKYLYAEKETVLALARNVVVTATRSVEEGRTLASSVASQVERIIADAVALTGRLGE